jgi:hypothetical protein
VENPGSLRQSLDKYPDLSRDEVMKIWSGELCKWREYVKLPVEVVPAIDTPQTIGQLVLFEETDDGQTRSHSTI